MNRLSGILFGLIILITFSFCKSEKTDTIPVVAHKPALVQKEKIDSSSIVPLKEKENLDSAPASTKNGIDPGLPPPKRDQQVKPKTKPVKKKRPIPKKKKKPYVIPTYTDRPAKGKEEGSSSTQAGNQTTNTNALPPVNSSAIIKFERELHDFGRIDQGEEIHYKFRFTNVGSAPLSINNVEATCGCTQPSIPLMPTGPGETGFIEVHFNSTGRLGNQRPMISVYTNGKPSLVKLFLEGVVLADIVEIDPKEEAEEKSMEVDTTKGGS